MTDMICFDKTGTLTEDFMDFYCLVPINEKKDDFDDAIINYGGDPRNFFWQINFEICFNKYGSQS